MIASYNTLNEVQQQAVETIDGPCLVFAGAGSGKTRVLTHRIAYILETKDVMPANILAVTFTNKAAREMRERIESLIQQDTKGMFVGTFHSLCSLLLRIDGDKIGIERGFTIFDSADQNQLIGECMKRLNIDEKQLTKRFFKGKISEAKSLGLGPVSYAKEFMLSTNDPILQVYELYEKRLGECSALDFDDLLLKGVKLLEESKETLEKYQERFEYIHVDEYQDTNATQYKLIKLLAQKHHNICVVGDDDQSIYSWRGADITNILNFEKDYPEAKLFYLEQNYRSTEHILKAANSVISNNSVRKEKALWSKLGRGERIKIYSANDEYDEAAFVCNEMMRLREMESIPLENMAVLYRTNAQSRVIEEKCMRYAIPYRVFGGLRFYDRKEIKDLIAYLRVVANPRDDVSLIRIINTPKRGIGNVTVQKLSETAASNGVSIMDVLMDMDAYEIDKRIQKKLDIFCALMTQLIALAHISKPTELVEHILNQTEYSEYIKAEQPENAQSRLENIDEFIASVAEFEQNNENATLGQFLENVSLSSDVEGQDDQETKYVTLMTLHSAKGLEFEVVFLLGMEDNLFPHASAMKDPQQLEEERRLCYVGITRAKRRLYLAHAIRRRWRNEYMRSRLSQFVSEINQENLYILKPHVFDQQPGMLNDDERKNPWNPPVNDGGIKKISPNKKDVFEISDKIEHDKFGFGTVIGVKGKGENAILNVAFDGQGIKQMSVAYAPIRKLEER